MVFRLSIIYLTFSYISIKKRFDTISTSFCKVHIVSNLLFLFILERSFYRMTISVFMLKRN